MKPGRNDSCPCGSGKKYKNCCQGKPEFNPPTPKHSEKGMAPTPAECDQLVALFNTGHHAELESRTRSLLERYPDSGFIWNTLGASLQMQGKDSLPALLKATELLPNDAEAHYNLGNTLKGAGRPDEAEASYRRALQINPDFAVAHYNLGDTLKGLGRLDEAEASYRRALQIKPDFVKAHNNLGSILKELGRLDEAEVSYRRALEFKPDFAEAHNNLSNILYEQGRLPEAEASYRRTLELKPDCAEAHDNLSNILYEQGRLPEAEASYRRTLELKPDCAEAHNNLGNILYAQDRFFEAEASYRHALKLNPEHSNALISLGCQCMDDGQVERAEELFLQALNINPNNVEARFSLAQLKKVKAGDANFAALVGYWEAARNNKTPLLGKKAILLHFALGKCYDDSGDYDKAFPHFLEGCKLKRATLDYNPERTTRQFSGIMHIFDQATISRLRGAGVSSRLPIFVLGMPRSGTTLTEQIISSHPDVYGGGELNELLGITRLNNFNIATKIDSVSLEERVFAWGTEYVARLQQRAPNAQHITDKMPTNFMAIGLIHLMLPNAKIIHVNRNPVDTCLSCFTQLFQHRHEETYNLAELGRCYVDYARLMEHWRNVLPADVFLDVNYEDVVADKEAQARRMIDYCGLEWNDACLDFHKNKRTVRTASVAQVRQPMYKSSVERWKHYEKFLGPLLDALGDLAPKR